MLKVFIFQMRNRPPIFTIMLILGCMISTIPQFFLPNIYSDISGQVPSLTHFYLTPLSSFTHSPGMLINHFIGNMMVFLFIGSITEIVIGSSRYAFISLLTFTSTTFINFLHSEGGIAGHGASGICWGYQIFFIFILIILYEIRGKSIFKDVFIILLLLLITFTIVGIPTLEVLVQNNGFFQNFGQVLHLISMIVVVPFIFLWRKDIEFNVQQILERKPLHPQRNLKSLPPILLILLLLINIYGTIKVITITNAHPDNVIDYIEPSIGSDITQIPGQIMIKFNTPVKKNSERLINTSINYETKEPPSFSSSWIDDTTMAITFSRKFQHKETLKLEYLVTMVTKEKIEFDELISIEYK